MIEEAVAGVEFSQTSAVPRDLSAPPAQKNTSQSGEGPLGNAGRKALAIVFLPNYPGIT